MSKFKIDSGPNPVVQVNKKGPSESLSELENLGDGRLPDRSYERLRVPIDPSSSSLSFGDAPRTQRTTTLIPPQIASMPIEKVRESNLAISLSHLGLSNLKGKDSANGFFRPGDVATDSEPACNFNKFENQHTVGIYIARAPNSESETFVIDKQGSLESYHRNSGHIGSRRELIPSSVVTANSASPQQMELIERGLLATLSKHCGVFN